MKIFIGQFVHETNTFAAEQTTMENFKLWEWDKGEGILQKHRGVRDYLGGMIDRAEALKLEIIPTISAMAYPSGTITKETYDEIKEELINSLKKHQADALCLNLHGAGVVEGIDDMEGYLLGEIRNAVGYDIPILCTLDLHANLTEKMVQEADVLLGVNFYPHTDSYERGMEAIDLAIKMYKKELNPVMHLTKLPLIIPTSTTNLSPAKDINEICWEWEKETDVVDCTFFHSFPYTDIQHVGVSVLSITNDDPALAAKASEDVANQILSIKERFFQKTLSPQEGLEQALQLEGHPIVINETSDNPGGGTPGDGTYLLRAMLDMGLENACFAFIYDKEVADLAHEAGVGEYIDIKLGGKTDNLHGEPLSVNAYIKSLTDGVFYQSSPMWQGLKNDLGKSVRLQVGGVDIIVCSIKSQVMDEQIFLLHGIDISKYKIVCLKSSQHFRAAFEPQSAKIITVDSPGLTTIDFTSFDYKHVLRPIYPLDQM
ncbi:M81 family metallopeptidase [Bacillus sp. OxB-1]|uniref:M81 family metallopeptidase n=1 Tax=Bacillus sp. (strain OxB-1) TaxID=98228 RepID=UPI00059788B5|nr:M81 family metallopeptidase [Bacillus sp. OxB-1]